MTTWRNWAGNQVARGLTAVGEVHSVDDVVAVVGEANRSGRRLKVVGSGHSFTGVARPEELVMSLEQYRGIDDVDVEHGTVTVRAGTTIADLNLLLAGHGLAMPNLGDVTYQSILGAVSTSTHGTGLTLGGLATQVLSFTLVTSSGEVLVCSREQNVDVWHAGRVSLGALGVVVDVTLRVVPAFTLHAVEYPEKVSEVEANFDVNVRENDHFEFYWVPHTKWALTKRNNRSSSAHTARRPVSTFWNKIVMENVAFGAVCKVGKVAPSLIPKLATALPSQGRQERVDASYRIFASKRLVRFCEMEYSIPLGALPEALGRVRKMVDDRGFQVSFPVEVRAAKGDDIPLSTAYGRDSAYVAVHMYRGMDFEPYFREVEKIMVDYGGRPHWGKIHFQDKSSLRPLYPEFDKFVELRDRLDPTGMFSNAYLNRVLGRQSGIPD